MKQKSIVIFGNPGSGKTSISKGIASDYKRDEVVGIYSRNRRAHEDPFIFGRCTPNTKLVIYEEIMDIKQLVEFLSLISNPITVNKKGEWPFVIDPMFVLICSDNIVADQIEALDVSILGRFDVLECKHLSFPAVV